MAIRRPLTPSQENYLEEICRMAETGPVRVGALALNLGVSLPSVSRGIDLLASKGYVRHRSYGAVELTRAGREAGTGIVRRHACLQRLFVEVLAMAPEEAERPIHHLEHGLSPSLLIRLEALTSLALSSEAWCRRLHHRISCRLSGSEPGSQPSTPGSPPPEVRMSHSAREHRPHPGKS